MSEVNHTLLTVINSVKIGRRRYSVCRCSCGNEKTIRGWDVRKGTTRSCGCLGVLASAALAAKSTTHGQTKTATYGSWKSMVRRCTNKNYPYYHNYGGRGIGVCERWRKFSNFLTDMGECPKGMELDRFPDQNGNYEPGNCRWSTSQQNQRNRRNNRKITCNGQTMLLCEWADKTGIKFATINSRLMRGWSPEQAMGLLPAPSRKQRVS